MPEEGLNVDAKEYIKLVLQIVRLTVITMQEQGMIDKNLPAVDVDRLALDLLGSIILKAVEE